MTRLPQCAIILARISKDREEEDERGTRYRRALGVTDQIADLREDLARRGWTIGPEATHVIVENDTSAFKTFRHTLSDGRIVSRTRRDEYQRLLVMLATGQADGLLAVDLDRTCRQPRDLEDLIDIVLASTPRIPVDSLTGSLRLYTDADITMARNMVSYAWKSSRDTSRRVARACRRRALDGKFHGGRRPYGFEADGVTPRPDECKVIVDAVTSILAGHAAPTRRGEPRSDSLRTIARELREAGVPTADGKAWSAELLRDVLVRPRIAGIMVHKGEEVGPAPWVAIVPEEQWRAVVAILTDPSRRNGPGPAPRWLGSGLYVCGLCGGPMQVHKVSTRPVYHCKASGHVVRTAPALDAYVSEVIVERLSRPDLRELLAEPSVEVDVDALRREATALRVTLDEFAADRAAGLITRSQMITGTEQTLARLGEIERELTEAVGVSPLAPIVAAQDARVAWAGLSLSDRRAVLKTLVRVVVLPGERGKGFNPRHVLVEPAHTLAA